MGCNDLMCCDDPLGCDDIMGSGDRQDGVTSRWRHRWGTRPPPSDAGPRSTDTTRAFGVQQHTRWTLAVRREGDLLECDRLQLGPLGHRRALRKRLRDARPHEHGGSSRRSAVGGH